MRKMIVTIILLGLLSAAVGCQGGEQPRVEDTLPAEYITAARAIELAGDLMPDAYIDRFTFTAEQTGDMWQVKAILYRNVLTAEELDWPAGDTDYLNYGLLPNDEFRLLVVELDAASGEVRSLTASDSLAMPEGDLPAAVSPACGGCE